jgi:hypothetical protein
MLTIRRGFEIKRLGVFARKKNRKKLEWSWECNRPRSQNHAKVDTMER